MNKICNECNLEKDVNDFRPRICFNKDKTKSYSYTLKICIKCENIKCTTRNKRNKEKIKIQRQLKRDTEKHTIEYHVQDRLSMWKGKNDFIVLFESELSNEYLINLYYKQKGLCYFTNVKMIIGSNLKKDYKNLLSLDRKDPKLGYVKGNVVWCTMSANLMKGNLNIQEFKELLKIILTINH